jgi:hypothetical protein
MDHIVYKAQTGVNLPRFYIKIRTTQKGPTPNYKIQVKKIRLMSSLIMNTMDSSELQAQDFS